MLKRPSPKNLSPEEYNKLFEQSANALSSDDFFKYYPPRDYNNNSEIYVYFSDINRLYTAFKNGRKVVYQAIKGAWIDSNGNINVKWFRFTDSYMQNTLKVNVIGISGETYKLDYREVDYKKKFHPNAQACPNHYTKEQKENFDSKFHS